jgi:adenosylcobyric acid synthase
MIQGTGSGVGKSVIVAALCRIFRDMGIRVAPFKAQNMALNSFITKEGGEIGRAQAFQAEAAGIEPCNDINPILLKAAGESGCQVILNGKVYGNMTAIDYYAFKDTAWKAVTAAYDRLSEKYDLIVIEGAGSPAEINLQKEEIVNMSVARYTNASVILVGDIDKGGVFASFYGTIELLKDNINPPSPPFAKGGQGGILSKEGKGELSDADYIKAFIVNKFRGDLEILRPGLRMIENKTGRPVIGVINYFGDLGLHEEDAIPLERLKGSKVEGFKGSKIRIVILRLRYISNFTDFDPFMYEPDVELKYSFQEEDINSADLIIIPGSKNTVSDLLFLREHGIEECLKSAVRKGTALIGICGGYQMLGEKIIDPCNVESSLKEVEGLRLLDIVTTLEKTKTTCQVSGEINSSKVFKIVQNSSNCDLKNLKGYEIHMGSTTGDIGLFKLYRLNSIDHSPPTHPSPSRGEGKGGGESLSSEFCALGSEVLDGSQKDNVWGTYIHGIFDNDSFRRELLNSLREKKGLPIVKEAINYFKLKDDATDKWADILRNSVDICFILSLLGMESYKETYCLKIK